MQRIIYDKYFTKHNGQAYRVTETYGDNLEIVYMVLVNGFQWSKDGNYDASGAGDSTFTTVKEARETYEQSN